MDSAALEGRGGSGSGTSGELEPGGGVESDEGRREDAEGKCELPTFHLQVCRVTNCNPREPTSEMRGLTDLLKVVSSSNPAPAMSQGMVNVIPEPRTVDRRGKNNQGKK